MVTVRKYNDYCVPSELFIKEPSGDKFQVWQEITIAEVLNYGFDLIADKDVDVAVDNNPFIHISSEFFAFDVDLGIATSEGYHGLIVPYNSSLMIAKIELDWWVGPVRLFFKYDNSFKKGNAFGKLFIIPTEIHVVDMEEKELNYREMVKGEINKVKPTRPNNQMAILTKKRKLSKLPFLPYGVKKKNVKVV